jgi:hypothetical protein
MRHSTLAAAAGLFLLLSAGLAAAAIGVVRQPRMSDLRQNYLLAGWNAYAEKIYAENIDARKIDLVIVCPSPVLHPDLPSIVVMHWDWAEMPAFRVELPEYLARRSPNLTAGSRVP